MTFLGTVFVPGGTRTAHAGEDGQLGDQIATDLIASGVTIGAALTGNVPLAFAAGFLAKYISVYGVRGIKSLVDFFKGYEPQDLGEINLYYVYLLHVKRNLYKAMISVREAVQNDKAFANLEGEIKRVEDVLSGECSVQNGCVPTALDDSLINYSFLNLIVDAKQSLDVSKFLGTHEVKNTYQYLMLLYLDVIIVEQKLIEAQYNMLASRTVDSLELIEKNKYISNAEKEFHAQLLLNMALRWVNLTDTRRVVIADAMKTPLANLGKENEDLQREIDEYRKRYGFLGFRAQGAYDEDYDEHMHRIQEDMEEAGSQVDAFASNPFQTGSALSGYYLSEKTLLLERDAFFQMKANKLETTEQVADYQHRIKVLRAHANNMLLQLIQAVDHRNKEGFTKIEQPKQQVDMDKLVEDCKKDSACVAERLQNRESSVQNILVDNFALASQIFSQIPYMNVLEVNSVYQLIQLIYLEVFHSQSIISGVEFELFFNKQKTMQKAIERNRNLTDTERRLHREMVVNTVNKWKKRILERKFDAAKEFEPKAEEVRAANLKLATNIVQVRSNRADVFGGVYKDEGSCLQFKGFQKWRWCKDRKRLEAAMEQVRKGKAFFLGSKEKKLPSEFWEEI
ncbi:MAG: hypothetical protein A2X94_07755 [Bdellovibrionales bacterium GWB1_55_8]|nr:MAG: hypothetical protein A2X94_07755 [Bdellovibrionales bacterium GWB1_55_8]